MYYTYRNLGSNGRLGNQLWQIASTIGISADRTGIAPTAQNIQLSDTHDAVVLAPAKFPQWRYMKNFYIPHEYFVDIDRVEVIEDFGVNYLQDLRHFSNIEDVIKGYFLPSPNTLEAVQRVYDWAVDIDDEVVSLHVRRGDAIGKEYYHPVHSASYYEEALSIMPCENPVVIVFSDDIEWCKVNLPPEFHYATPQLANAYTENDYDILDMALMSMCSYHVISNSTFSWWGAYLADSKKVVYPTNWYGPGLADVDYTLMIPDGWIGL